MVVAIRNPITHIGAVGGRGQRFVTIADRLDDTHRGMKRTNILPDADDAKRIANNISDIERPGLIGKGMDAATAGAGTLGMASIFAPMAIGGVGGLVEKTGDKLVRPGIEKFGQKIQAPVRWIEKTQPIHFAESRTGKMIGRGANGLFSGIGNAVEALSDATGIGSRLHNRFTGKMYTKLAHAGEFAHIDSSAIHESIRPQFEKLHNLAAKAASPAHVDMNQLREAHVEWHEAKGALKKGVKAVADSSGKSVNQFERAVGSAVEHHAAAGRYKNIGASIAGIPKAWSKRSMRENVEYGAFFGSSILSILNTARSAWKDWQVRKQFLSEIKGVDSNIASQSRWHIIKTLFSREALELVSLGILAKQARNGHVSGLVVGGQIAGSMGIESLMGEFPLDAYKRFSMARSAGKPSAEEYAYFIGAINEDLKSRGGAESPITQKLAAAYCAEKATVKTMVEESGNGKMMWRAHEIIRTNEAAHRKPVSHVAKINGATPAAKHEVVGKHTENVAKRAETAGEHVGVRT